MTAAPQVIAELVGGPRPVLLADTCLLLDVLSGPARIDGFELKSAVDIWNAVCSAKPVAVMVLAEVVWSKELQQRRQAAEEEFKKYANRWQYDTLTCEIFAEALGDTPPAAATSCAENIRKSLVAIYENLVGASIQLERDNECESRGMDRVRDKIAPAHKKGGFKDAIIIEQYLKFCRDLRAAGVSAPVAFLTSNKNDFCGPGGRTLHTHLVDDFASNKLDLCLTWADAKRILKL